MVPPTFGGSEKGQRLISAYRSLATNTPRFKKLSTGLISICKLSNYWFSPNYIRKTPQPQVIIVLTLFCHRCASRQAPRRRRCRRRHPACGVFEPVQNHQWEDGSLLAKDIFNKGQVTPFAEKSSINRCIGRGLSSLGSIHKIHFKSIRFIPQGSWIVNAFIPWNELLLCQNQKVGSINWSLEAWIICPSFFQ